MQPKVDSDLNKLIMLPLTWILCVTIFSFGSTSSARLSDMHVFLCDAQSGVFPASPQLTFSMAYYGDIL